MRAAGAGKGRIVQFLVSPRMWDAEYLGHFQGLDGLLWRSIAWAARKPFAMLVFPPFVAFRVDDANGSANLFGKRPDSANRGFGYLYALHEHGYIPNVGLFVDDISEVLAAADAPGILDRYYKEGKGRDPVVHFYETFLARYDPQERERRGVYYTPEAVVSYIVRSLHHLLKSEFGKPDGLASEGVTLLDPAAGTITTEMKTRQMFLDAAWDFIGQSDAYGGDLVPD